MKINNKSVISLVVLALIPMVVGCSHNTRQDVRDSSINAEDSIVAGSSGDITAEQNTTPVEIVDICGLRIYFPNYSKIDLVCGTMPSKDDESVIMFAEAAFTGELLEEFSHKNISSSHVSNGEYHSGYLCKRSRGVFAFYNGEPHFVYQGGFQKVPWPKYMESALRTAAHEGGCGFAQEIMIHEGRKTPHTRPDGNTNEFRALCLVDDKVAIVDSQGAMKFGDFIDNLLKAGATEALYLDMGSGWNYSWYRDANGQPVEIHSTPTKYATNWITFYI